MVEESSKRADIGAEIVAIISEQMAYELDGPPARVAAPNVTVPFAPPMEKFYTPQADDIVVVHKIAG